MVEHTELFWSLFTVDVDAALDVQPPDTWDSFSLFQLLNDYFNKDRESIVAIPSSFLLTHVYCIIIYLSASLRNGPSHIYFQNKFAPLVIRYVDLMESSIAQSVHNGFEKETWAPVG